MINKYVSNAKLEPWMDMFHENIYYSIHQIDNSTRDAIRLKGINQ